MYGFVVAVRSSRVSKTDVFELVQQTNQNWRKLGRKVTFTRLCWIGGRRWKQTDTANSRHSGPKLTRMITLNTVSKENIGVMVLLFVRKVHGTENNVTSTEALKESLNIVHLLCAFSRQWSAVIKVKMDTMKTLF